MTVSDGAQNGIVCPDCGGDLSELGEGVRCSGCGSLHQPCWADGCTGFFTVDGWDGQRAVLSCGKCGTETTMPDRFAPPDNSRT